MDATAVTVRVPASTANLGPGFDCLGLALALWNEVTFSRTGEGIRVEVSGLGAGELPAGEDNLIARGALRVFARCGEAPPQGLAIRCESRIPPCSGMGSSAAAVLSGLLGGNALLGGPLSQEEILRMAVEAEGHPDNAAAALLGGLVISTGAGEELLVRRVLVAPVRLVVVTPEYNLSTRQARAALPRQVAREDAVFNLGRTALTVEALRAGDYELLRRAMQDRLHQPHRLPLIPGATQAFRAALDHGAAAAALSGAGPSLIAFAPQGLEEIGDAMAAAFSAAGLASRVRCLDASGEGAAVDARML